MMTKTNYSFEASDRFRVGMRGMNLEMMLRGGLED
jgi:hypothetical protein